MSLKKIIIIISILIIFILVLFGVLVFLSSRDDRQGGTPPPSSGDGSRDRIPGDDELPIKEFETSFKPGQTQEPGEEEIVKSELKLLVRNFVEDYGSFSTNSGYAHIQNMYADMTQAMRSKTEVWLADNPLGEKSPTFYSIEASVIELDFVEFLPNRARITFDTSRSETDVPEYYNKTFRQGGEVVVVQEEGEWKIDALTWQ